MISSLFARNTAVQERIRTLPDHLNATIPGSNRRCPPTDLAAQVLDVEWKMLHNDWSKVGSAMLGQWSQDTVQETIEMYKDGLCMPPGIYAEGLLAPSHVHPLDRDRIKPPVRPPPWPGHPTWQGTSAT
eukprot:8220871-Pyramimonas_sp.AAC.1